MYLLQIKAQNTKMLDIFPVTGPVVSDGLRTSLSDWTVANSFDQANKDKHREKVLLNHQTEIYHVTRLARRAPAPAVIRLKRQSPPFYNCLGAGKLPFGAGIKKPEKGCFDVI